MKSFRKELWFNVPARRGFVNITGQVEHYTAGIDTEKYYKRLGKQTSVNINLVPQVKLS